MEQIIVRYGLAAIFLGAAIEGEPFALAGGILAHRHWISITAAGLAAIAGAYAVDQFWFQLSRRFRHSRLAGRMRQRPAFARSLAIVERHPVWFLLLFRFAYGVRAIAPVAIGSTNVKSSLYMPLTLVAAIVWGILFTSLGYLLGPALEAAESRFGLAITFATIGLSGLALFLTLRRAR